MDNLTENIDVSFNSPDSEEKIQRTMSCELDDNNFDQNSTYSSSSESVYSETEITYNKPKDKSYTSSSEEIETLEELQETTPDIPNIVVNTYQDETIEIIRFDSLNSFYIRLLTQSSLEAQLLLENELNEFYGQPEDHTLYTAAINSKAAIKFEGNWRRCVVKEVFDQSCNVFLVDLGININVKQNDLRSLALHFTLEEKGCIHCKLADVAPSKGRLTFTERAKQEFKKLVMDSKFKVKALFIHIEKYRTPHSIVVYTFPGNGMKININAALTKRLDCVVSTGPESSGKLATFNEESAAPVREVTNKLEKSQISGRIEVKILHINNPSNFFVEFIEEAMSLNAPQAAIRMHMKGAKPTGSLQNWSLTATDKFVESMRHFKKTFVSIVGDKNEYQSFPVIVWGAEIKSFDFCVQTKFHNINSWIHDLGLIDLDSPLLHPEIFNLEWSVNSEFDSLQDIKSWMPAKDLVEMEFDGFVTYIDENGEISIRDDSNNEVFQKMILEFDDIYSSPNFTNVLKEITEGHAVIVYNEVDARYYRGIVEGFSSVEGFYVRFVDIGTAAFFNREQIFTSVVSGEIPVLVRKYRLGSIVPEQNSDQWPEGVLDFLYGVIVEKRVKVIVKNFEEVSDCSIFINEEDIELLLVNKKLARLRLMQDNWPPKQKVTIDRNLNDFDHNKYLFIKKKSMKNEFDEMAADFIKPSEVEVSTDETKQYLKDFEKDLNIEINVSQFSFKARSSSAQPHCEINFPDIERIQKQRIKRRFAKRYEKTVNQFDLLFSDIGRFECTFVAAFESRKVFILPNIPELNEEIVKLTEAIGQINQPFLVLFKRPEKHLKQLCLVEIANEWHRGTIVAVDKNLVSIFLIDSAKFSLVEKTKIYRLPLQFHRYPRKVLNVKLNDITPNANFTENEIAQKLKILLTDMKLTAIVKGFDEKDFPLVELEANGKLAYQELIDKNILLPDTKFVL